MRGKPPTRRGYLFFKVFILVFESCWQFHGVSLFAIPFFLIGNVLITLFQAPKLTESLAYLSETCVINKLTYPIRLIRPFGICIPVPLKAPRWF